MEKAREFCHPLYICFIDLKKAYDLEKCNTLWTILQRLYNPPPKLLPIISALHEDSVAATRAYEKPSEVLLSTMGSSRVVCSLPPSLILTLMWPFAWPWNIIRYKVCLWPTFTMPNPWAIGRNISGNNHHWPWLHWWQGLSSWFIGWSQGHARHCGTIL